jgi:hypothetical protein
MLGASREAVGAGARQRRDLGCVEGGSGEPGRDSGGVLGASRVAVGSRGETAAGSWVRRGRQWGAGARWRSAMLGRKKFNYNYYRYI